MYIVIDQSILVLFLTVMGMAFGTKMDTRRYPSIANIYFDQVVFFVIWLWIV